MVEITKAVAEKVLETVDAGLCTGLGAPVPGQMCVEAAVCFALGLPHSDEPSCVSPALRAFKIRLNDAAWSSNEDRAKGLRRLALIQLGSAGHLDDNQFARRLVELAIRKAVPAAFRSAAAIQKDTTHKSALLHRADICECEGTCLAALTAKTVASDAADAAYAAACAACAADAADADACACAAAYAYTAACAACAAAAYAYAAYAAACAACAADAADAAACAAHASKTVARDTLLSEFAEAVVQLLIEMDVPGKQWLELAPLES